MGPPEPKVEAIKLRDVMVAQRSLRNPGVKGGEKMYRVGDGAGAGGNTRTHTLTCSVSDSRRSGCSRGISSGRIWDSRGRR